MKKNNGFTLVELLAVIVVLGIIMTIAGIAAIKVKKDANVKEAVQLEHMLKQAGEDLYSHYMITGFPDNNPFSDNILTVSELNKTGYLKTEAIQNPNGNGECTGFVEVSEEEVEHQLEKKFKAYICCPDLYKTGYQSGNENTSISCTK